jgi:lipopolysaccharide export system permease protein
MMAGTLQRYFARRFLGAVLAVFGFSFVLIALIDYVELMRRASSLADVSALVVAQASLCRVPQITERLMPFAVLIGTMICFLSLSRRLELVVARSAGVSAWQFIAPAAVVAFVLGLLATLLYNPLSAMLDEYSKRLETQIFGEQRGGSQPTAGGFWLSQRTGNTSVIINATTSLQQGAVLAGVIVLQFDASGRFRQRIDARRATLEPGHWRLEDARIYAAGTAPRGPGEYLLETSLTPEQVRETFAVPESVPFWHLPEYIERAERMGIAAAAYRLHYHKLLAQPFLLAAMVFLAAAVSLRFFRLGGVQKMVLIGVLAGFLLYVFSKVMDDLSKAELMHPFAAAWLPILTGGSIGIVALLYQEDG